MWTPLITRVHLRLQKIKQNLDPVEREFGRVWPLVDPVEGWLYIEEAKWLFASALSLPGYSNIVEIGSYKGRSTCCLAFGAKSNDSRVFAIDSFDGGPGLPRAHSFPDFSQNIRRCGLSPTVEPIVGLSSDVSKDWDRPIHMLFIDGSHAYEDVLADFAAFFPHVVSGGLVAFHDAYNADWPGVLRAWTETIQDQLAETGQCKTLAYGRKPKGRPARLR